MGLEIQTQLNAAKQTVFYYAGGSGHTFEGPISQATLAVTPATLSAALNEHKVSVIVDFSTLEANELLLNSLEQSTGREYSVIVGTTGLSPSQIQRWQALGSIKHRILIAPNTSIGILLLAKVAMQITGVTTHLSFDTEIVETHHREKKDAPSGTAKFLADSITRSVDRLKAVWHRDNPRRSGEVGIHAIRGGGVYGEHAIRILGDNEEICLSHRAFSRSLFASGALTLSRWLTKKPPGFYYLWDIGISELQLIIA